MVFLGIEHIRLTAAVGGIIRQRREGASLGLDTLVGLAGHNGQYGNLSLGKWLIAHDRIVIRDFVEP